MGAPRAGSAGGGAATAAVAETRMIVNADDFGLSYDVNRGIIAAHERGIVTSASLMVRCDAAVDAAGYARDNGRLSVGLHVDLGEWVPAEGGDWRPLYSVVALDDHAAVAAEVERQLQRFRRLLRRKPTHVDSHQHVHRSEPVRSVLRGLAERLAVPLRGVGADIRYCGDFYGQGRGGSPRPEAITAEALTAIALGLPPGTTEVACHPGDCARPPSPYGPERRAELAALCDPSVRQAIAAAGVVLCSFATYRDEI